MRKLFTISLLFIFITGFLSTQIFADEADYKPTVIVVVGAGGTNEYQVQFNNSGNLWQNACAKGNANYIPIGLSPVDDINDIDILRKAIENQSNETDAAIWLVFIGHGTFDGQTAKFNLRGPDVSADDLAKWLKPIKRPIAVINASSSSSPFINKLSGPDRVIITATKSGFELSYARFGLFFTEVMLESSSDLDKDGQTSLLEAFLAAARQVEEFYSAAGRLATEHALIDDNGDGMGTSADWYQGIKPVQRGVGNKSPDGYRAHQFCLIPSELESKMPYEMRAKRDELELKVIKLRDSKESYTEDEYFSKLEELLFQIAKIYDEID